MSMSCGICHLPIQTGGLVEEVEGGTELFYWMDQMVSKLEGQSGRVSNTYRKLMGRDDPCYEFDWDNNIPETKVWRVGNVQRLNNFSKHIVYDLMTPGKEFTCTVTVDYSSGSSQVYWIPGKKPTGISVVSGGVKFYEIDVVR
jgi:hypothetical protein